MNINGASHVARKETSSSSEWLGFLNISGDVSSQGIITSHCLSTLLAINVTNEAIMHAFQKICGSQDTVKLSLYQARVHVAAKKKSDSWAADNSLT